MTRTAIAGIQPGKAVATTTTAQRSVLPNGPPLRRGTVRPGAAAEVAAEARAAVARPRSLAATAGRGGAFTGWNSAGAAVHVERSEIARFSGAAAAPR